MIESNERLVLKQAEIITKLTNESRNKSKEIEDLYNKLDIVNLNAAYWKMLQAAILEDEGMYSAWRSFMTGASIFNRGPDETPAINAMIKNLYPEEWMEDVR